MASRAFSLFLYVIRFFGGFPYAVSPKSAPGSLVGEEEPATLKGWGVWSVLICGLNSALACLCVAGTAVTLSTKEVSTRNMSSVSKDLASSLTVLFATCYIFVQRTMFFRVTREIRKFLAVLHLDPLALRKDRSVMSLMATVTVCAAYCLGIEIQAMITGERVNATIIILSLLINPILTLTLICTFGQTANLLVAAYSSFTTRMTQQKKNAFLKARTQQADVLAAIRPEGISPPSLPREEEVRRIKVVVMSLSDYQLLLEDYFGPLLLAFLLSSTINCISWVFYFSSFPAMPLRVRFYMMARTVIEATPLLYLPNASSKLKTKVGCKRITLMIPESVILMCMCLTVGTWRLNSINIGGVCYTVLLYFQSFVAH